MNSDNIFIFFYEAYHPKHKDYRWSFTIKDYNNNMHIINRKEVLEKQIAIDELNKILAGIYGIVLNDLLCEESISNGMIFYYTEYWRDKQRDKEMKKDIERIQNAEPMTEYN